MNVPDEPLAQHHFKWWQFIEPFDFIPSNRNGPGQKDTLWFFHMFEMASLPICHRFSKECLTNGYLVHLHPFVGRCDTFSSLWNISIITTAHFVRCRLWTGAFIDEKKEKDSSAHEALLSALLQTKLNCSSSCCRYLAINENPFNKLFSITKSKSQNSSITKKEKEEEVIRCSFVVLRLKKVHLEIQTNKSKHKWSNDRVDREGAQRKNPLLINSRREQTQWLLLGFCAYFLDHLRNHINMKFSSLFSVSNACLSSVNNLYFTALLWKPKK